MLRHLRFEENMIKHRTLLLVACLSVAGIAAGCQNDTAEDTTNSRSSGARIDNAARPIDPNTGLPMPPGTDVNRNNLGNTRTGAQQPGATGTGTASGRGTNTGTAGTGTSGAGTSGTGTGTGTSGAGAGAAGGGTGGGGR